MISFCEVRIPQMGITLQRQDTDFYVLLCGSDKLSGGEKSSGSSSALLNHAFLHGLPSKEKSSRGIICKKERSLLLAGVFSAKNVWKLLTT